jgi:hypothetical protein
MIFATGDPMAEEIGRITFLVIVVIFVVGMIIKSRKHS